MIQPYTENQPLVDNQFLITVQDFLRTTQWILIVSSTDRICELKCTLSHMVDASIHELSIFATEENSTPFPYPLRDDMKLENLQVEHRCLLFLIHESPEKLAPRRLLLPRYDSKKPILDLTHATDEDLTYLRRWIVRDYASQVSAVHIPWRDPRFAVMMKEITTSLDNAYMDDIRPGYPYRYVLVESDTKEDQPLITLEQRNALVIFFRILGECHNFRKIAMYAEKGVLGNTEDQPMRLTKENMATVDLILADAIGDRPQP